MRITVNSASSPRPDSALHLAQVNAGRRGPRVNGPEAMRVAPRIRHTAPIALVLFTPAPVARAAGAAG
jgi:hypothetical protein